MVPAGQQGKVRIHRRPPLAVLEVRSLAEGVSALPGWQGSGVSALPGRREQPCTLPSEIGGGGKSCLSEDASSRDLGTFREADSGQCGVWGVEGAVSSQEALGVGGDVHRF